MQTHIGYYYVMSIIRYVSPKRDSLLVQNMKYYLFKAKKQQKCLTFNNDGRLSERLGLLISKELLLLLLWVACEFAFFFFFFRTDQCLGHV